MTDLPLISTWPPEDDIDGRLAASDLSQFAREVAAIIATKCRHVPESSRREMAEYIADGIGNALYDVGGRLDVEVFVALCGVAA